MLAGRLTRSTVLHLVAMLLLVALVFTLQGFARPAAAKLDLSNGLLVTTRDSLRVCLNVPDGLDRARVAPRLAGILAEIRQHPDWLSAGYGPAVPVLESGCAVRLPDGPVGRGAEVGPGMTENPGPYRTVIVVVSEARARALLGDSPARFVSYETMRLDDHTAATVTQGLIIRESALDQPEVATPYLTLALGLETPLPGEGSAEAADGHKGE